ncbi:unnamed protein product [Hermetia illucens]|uniref:Uncharacterized protein n=2 Tax=Hermetia illucens TaxID=343691 RepID=A0A7R8UKV0_HERIL|nr:unnamed protein product [Hermetia illucens]
MRCIGSSAPSHEDSDRQISGEQHVAVTVHQQQSHQYQALDSPGEESCDCNQSSQEQSGRSSRIVSADETLPSGSEDNGRRKCTHRNNRLNATTEQQRHLKNGPAKSSQVSSSTDERNYSSQIEVYSDGTDSGVKVTDGATSEEDQGPPLPPRPPPRPRNVPASENAPHSTGVRKYVIWCLIAGVTSCLLGTMFLAVYFLLRSYTSTLGYFETVPTFVPATLLILTGVCIMSLARRRNRYSYLIKLSGACGLASALTCALVTVTTTVLHMSRLQALRECEYTQKTRTCTCYSVMIESQVDGVDEDRNGVRFVFDSTADCGVVHGALYSCLRAVFGLSVAGVLAAVFSCMLVYQLLSHERKKMYWEQLELRCRSLYASQQGPPPPPPCPPNGPSIIGTPRANACRCCEQCHSHRNAMPTTYPWDGEQRFWAPGQPGNFYSPNPGGDELANSNRGMSTGNQRRGIGWSWPRMPWQRNDTNRFRQTPSSPDSQYGFSNTPAGPDAPGMTSSQGGYSVIGSVPYGVWGPPPPYSDPNSPARRGRYQYVHPNQCQTMMDHQIPQTQQNIPNMECHQHSSSTDSHSMEPFCPQQNRNVIKRQSGFKTKDNYENTPSDSDGPRDRFSNTLPVRKTKKRVETGAKSIGPNSQPSNRVNVQNVFTPIRQDHMEHEYHEPGSSGCDQNNGGQVCHSKSKRMKTGVDNTGFQNVEGVIHEGENCVRVLEPTESEVYFADVSSCCNISVKNDNYYDDANQRRASKEKEETSTKFNKDENEDYLAQRFGKREASVRSRLPFPQMIPEDYEKPQMNLPIVAPRTSLIPKDVSRQSMCSVDSGEKTDFTDLSPATPCTNFVSQHFTQNNFSPNQNQDMNEANPSTFVASFPFSSNEQSQEAHRRSTKNLQEVFLAPDAQYEVIKDTNQFESTPLTLSTYDQDLSYNNKSSHFHKPKSPKNLNLTPIKRQNIGANITTIIQNLGGSDVGLLYPDNRRNSDHDIQERKQSQQQQQQQQQQQKLVGQVSSDNEWSDQSDRRL